MTIRQACKERRLQADMQTSKPARMMTIWQAQLPSDKLTRLSHPQPRPEEWVAGKSSRDPRATFLKHEWAKRNEWPGAAQRPSPFASRANSTTGLTSTY